MPGTLDHRLYAWNGVGHLVAALGMLLVFIVLLWRISRLFEKKWLFWIGVLAIAATWLTTVGVSNEYNAHFTWTRKAGITNFHVETESWLNNNPLWQTLVRWQVQTEFDSYLRASRLKRTDPYFRVKVVSFVPIAVPGASSDDGPEWPNTEWEH